MPHCRGGGDTQQRTLSWALTRQLLRPQTRNPHETYLTHCHSATFSPPLFLQSITLRHGHLQRKKATKKIHLTSESHKHQAKMSNKKPNWNLLLQVMIWQRQAASIHPAQHSPLRLLQPSQRFFISSVPSRDTGPVAPLRSAP